MLSFIVPAYNVEKYILRCLDSLLPFIERGHEVIVVNDGSTDKTLDILSEYCSVHKQIKLITQENRGLSGARNSGLEVARGEYVWFIDSDDFVDYSEATDLLNLITRDYDIIAFGRTERFNNRTLRVPRFKAATFKTGNDYFEDAVNGGYYRTNVWDKIYRRSLIEENHIRFIEGLLYEDMFFNLQAMAFARSTASVPVYPYQYEKDNPDSISTRIKVKDLDVLKFVKLGFEFRNNYQLSDNDYDNAFYQLMFNWVSSCLINKYAILSLTNREAEDIFKQTIQNRYFVESARFCSDRTVRMRYKCFAKLLLFSPKIYRLAVISALKILKIKSKISH